jgi:hypothetical protein
MRFVSKFQKFSIKIRPHIEVVQANGQRHIVQQGLFCQFEPGDVTDWEVKAAFATFKFNGMPTEEDEVTAIDPLYRLSSFDTSTIADPETRKLYEVVLQNSFSNGVDYIYVPKPEVAPPWPTYDRYKAKGEELPAAIVRRVLEDGHSLHTVLEYEREHQNRPDVVFAIEQAILEHREPVEEESEDIVVA